MKDNLIFVLFVIVTAFSFNSCTTSSNSEVQVDTQSEFFVDDADHLFFKNTRAYYYDQSPGPGSDPSKRMNLYRLKKFSNRNDRAILIPLIVDNWIKDEAYLMLSTNEFDEGFSNPLHIAAISEGDTSLLIQEGRSMIQQTQFAQRIAEAIKADQNMLIQNEAQEWSALFSDLNDQLHYLTTIRDYQRMVKKEN